MNIKAKRNEIDHCVSCFLFLHLAVYRRRIHIVRSGRCTHVELVVAAAGDSSRRCRRTHRKRPVSDRAKVPTIPCQVLLALSVRVGRFRQPRSDRQVFAASQQSAASRWTPGPFPVVRRCGLQGACDVIGYRVLV